MSAFVVTFDCASSGITGLVILALMYLLENIFCGVLSDHRLLESCIYEQDKMIHQFVKKPQNC